MGLAFALFGQEARAWLFNTVEKPLRRRPDQSVADYLIEHYAGHRAALIQSAALLQDLLRDWPWARRRISLCGASCVYQHCWLKIAHEYLLETTGSQMIEGLEREGEELAETGDHLNPRFAA
jgi:hypothetical protein